MAVRVIEKNTTEQNPKCLESPVTYNLRPKTKTNCSRWIDNSVEGMENPLE